MAETSQAAVATPIPAGPIPSGPVPAGTTAAGARRNGLKRLALGLALTTGLVGAALWGYRYWTVGQYLVATDDAYVQADYTTTAPKVSGYIADVLVNDNQPVKAGQVLARIDDRDFRAALDQAKADVDVAATAIHNIDAQITLQQSMIDQSKSDIASTEATLRFAQQEYARYTDLAKTGYGTVQHAQQADSSLHQQEAQLQGNRAGLVAAEKKLDVLATDRASAVAQLAHAQAVEHQAELNLSYTVITAAVDGTVGSRSLRVGQYVQAGTQLMAVVPLHAVYIVANYKETQLTHVRDGQSATVEIDTFPGVKLRGHVDSLAPASGLEFALLPPDNATGNFTKIVQRIPVKIVLDDPALAGLLRPGMSVEPTIDTKKAG
ncbi:hemolysin secretion protein D [Aliidongia dinghuensis]|uniref:Hemolysin secretion protein D n=1 Tax=Aliidongia dinghuensis TaxID=1867774 RepID=A0A8J3E2F0_9PROT|nr:HlyD family secretion protein [Aliidongia dinghuensis]GGF20645.1 hemolysin secretion protein D [Aliidongia dinghuensis]